VTVCQSISVPSVFVDRLSGVESRETNLRGELMLTRCFRSVDATFNVGTSLASRKGGGLD
jgi:hypothetical protein